MFYLKTIGLICCLAATYALPAQDEARATHNAIQTDNDLLDNMYADCLRKDSLSCVKYKLFSFVDKMLGHKDTITVTEGVQLIKTENNEPETAPRALNGDDSIESLILNRVARFLDTHTIKVDLKGSEIVNAVSSTARSLGDVVDSMSDDEDELTEEGRGKKKKVQKVLGPLMAAAALKMAILGKLALAAIALIAGKALLIGKIALVLSAIIGLKKLLGGQGKHVTYEVVSHPQHSSSHTSSHETVYGGAGGGGGGGGYGGDIGGGGYSGGSSSGHGGWGRSFDAQQLAYKAHVPQQQQQEQQQNAQQQQQQHQQQLQS